MLTTKTADSISGMGKNNTQLQLAPIKVRSRQDRNFSRIRWGINFSTGLSTLSEGIFLFKGSVSTLANTSAVPGTSTGGGGTVLYDPSPNKPVLAFRAGINVKKNISSRSSLSAGLTYARLGDRIKIGTNQNSVQQTNSSSAFAYYQASRQYKYNDHFNFIELPLLYAWRLNKNPGRFSLSGGASIGYLFSTNGLAYDTTLSGVYYHDRSLFRRVHLNILSGMSYHVTSKKNIDFSVGPQFSFDMSRLIKTNADPRKYLFFGGIDARIFFEKKR